MCGCTRRTGPAPCCCAGHPPRRRGRRRWRNSGTARPSLRQQQQVPNTPALRTVPIGRLRNRKGPAARRTGSPRRGGGVARGFRQASVRHEELGRPAHLQLEERVVVVDHVVEVAEHLEADPAEQLRPRETARATARRRVRRAPRAQRSCAKSARTERGTGRRVVASISPDATPSTTMPSSTSAHPVRGIDRVLRRGVARDRAAVDQRVLLRVGASAQRRTARRDVQPAGDDAGRAVPGRAPSRRRRRPRRTRRRSAR